VRFPFISIFVLLLIALAVPVVADDRDNKLRRLEEIEERLNEALSALDEKKTAELDLLDDLNGVDRSLRLKQQRVSRSNRQLSKLEKEIKNQKNDLRKNQKEVEKLQGQVQQRLVALYKSEETGTLKTLFSANSASQILEDYDFLGRVVKHDRELLKEYRNRLAKRQVSLDRLAVSKKRQQRLLADLKKEERELQNTRKLKERFLAAVRRDRNALDSIVAELRKRAARLTSLVKGLESGQGAEYTEKTALFPLQKGLLPWPVKGQIKVGFGTRKHPELGTLIESHGIEISVVPETPIKAVWHGRVAFAKRFQGYGNLLIIDHEDGYYTLYAQAERLLKKSGDKVKKGDAVAVSGYDGNDYVYFEIRNGSTPLDPAGWIARR
jgi:septal ring factor EnvC (AmiA/AmiB activator)